MESHKKVVRKLLKNEVNMLRNCSITRTLSNEIHIFEEFSPLTFPKIMFILMYCRVLNTRDFNY